MAHPEALLDLVGRALRASPNERIDFRDAIAGHGIGAVDAMAEWLADPVLTRFAVRVIGRVADLGERETAIETLRLAREEATPDQQADIDAELRRLGADAQKLSRRRGSRGAGGPPDRSVPGWMMRTDRSNASWLWAELQAGRLRQGWGYQPSQELTLLRDRRERGEPMSRDEDWAWPNRRLLADEPDGMQVGDLVLLPHLPREWRWSVARITGSYRFEIDPAKKDFGHILPAEIVVVDLGDEDLTDELRAMRTYPGRLRRLSRQAYEDLQWLLARIRSQSGSRLPGAITLVLELREDIAEFDPADLVKWRDPAWWESGAANEVLPESEWHRIAKFRNQAAGGLVGYHFVEVQQMRALAREGLSWLYENFDFFAPPGKSSRVFASGYEVIRAAFGDEALDRLHDLATRFERDRGLAPRTPDLFAYRERGGRIVPERFIELKRSDAVSEAQLLGLALIREVLGAEVAIVRYVERGTAAKRKAHRRVFELSAPSEQATR